MVLRTANENCEVEFREVIATIIPSIIELLEDKDGDVRLNTVRLIAKLANRGEWQLDGITALLMRIAKSSFVKPLQEVFHRLLNYSRTRTRTSDGRLLS
jgi:hypothetical protein